jgi:thiazole synthase
VKPLRVHGAALESRLFLGTAGYPSIDVLARAAKAAQPSVLTVALRRMEPLQRGGQSFWSAIQALGVRVLPNTAGCTTAREAVEVAKMARELFETAWIKLEITGDESTLQPHPLETVRAAEALCAEGFSVFPYTTLDVVIGRELVAAGCQVLMPWASPIGSARGFDDVRAFDRYRHAFANQIIVVDAGLGRPSHAAIAMEHGADAVLVNTAVARADDPVGMARAFALGVHAGWQAYVSGMVPPSEEAHASSALEGIPFRELLPL